MQINIADLIVSIKSSKYGTGTLSTRLKIHPDILQKVIATGECEVDLFEKLGEVLGQELSEAAIVTSNGLPDKGTGENMVAETNLVSLEVPAQVIIEEELPLVAEDLSPAQPEIPIGQSENEEDVRDWLSGTNTEEIELTRASEIAIANSVNKLKLLVSQGEVNPEQLLQVEQEREYPRVSLTKWLLQLIGTDNGDSSEN